MHEGRDDDGYGERHMDHDKKHEIKELIHECLEELEEEMGERRRYYPIHKGGSMGYREHDDMMDRIPHGYYDDYGDRRGVRGTGRGRRR